MYSRIEKEYTGGPQVFTTNFALGVLEPEHLTAYVRGEVDGTGAPILRAFTYDPASGDMTLTAPLPNPATVILDRTVPKDILYVAFAQGAEVNKGNLDRQVIQCIHAVHEVLDGRWAISDELEALVNQALLYANAAGASAEAAAASAALADLFSRRMGMHVVSYIGDGVNKTFALNGTPYSSDFVRVYINGVHQHRTEYTVVGTNVVLNVAPWSFDKIEIEVFNVVIQSVGLLANQVTATNGATVQDYIDYTIVPFPNRTTAQNASIPPWIGTISIRHGTLSTGVRVLQYFKDVPNGTFLTTADGARWSPIGDPTPAHAGAVGNGSTDDTVAMETYAAFCTRVMPLGPKRFMMGGLRYRITRPIQFGRSVSSPYRHVFDWTALEWVIDFECSVDQKRAIIFGDPTLVAQGYYGNFDVQGRHFFSFLKLNAPVTVCFAFNGQVRYEGANSGGGLNNVVVEYLGAQNTEMENYKLYSGGHTFGYRAMADSLWRRTGNTINRVSGTDQLLPSDVGKLFSVVTGGTNQLQKITAVTSPTSATFSGGTFSDTVDRVLEFGSPSPKTTAGSATFTLDGEDPITTGLLGKRVGIPRAGALDKIWWGFIVAVDPVARSITLDSPAGATLDPVTNPLTDSEDIATPQVFMDSAVPPATNGQSQHRFINGQHEWPRGIAFGCQDAEHVHFMLVKMHAIQTGQTWKFHTVGCIWGNTLSGSYYGEFDARFRGRRRVYVADQTQGFHFSYMSTRMQVGETFLDVGRMRAGYQSAKVSFGIFHSVGINANIGFDTLVVDRNPVNIGWCPPEHYNKTDRVDDWWYKGTYNWWRANGSFSQGNDVLVNNADTKELALRQNGITRITVTVRGAKFNLPVYADNAAAITGGLIAQDAYCTPTGAVYVVI